MNGPGGKPEGERESEKLHFMRGCLNKEITHLFRAHRKVKFGWEQLIAVIRCTCKMADLGVMAERKPL